MHCSETSFDIRSSGQLELRISWYMTDSATGRRSPLVNDSNYLAILKRPMRLFDGANLLAFRIWSGRGHAIASFVRSHHRSLFQIRRCVSML